MRSLAGLLLLLFVTLPVLATSHPTPIHSYVELLNALAEGQEIRAIISFNKCLSSDQKKITDSVGGLNFTNFNKYKIPIKGIMKSVIATSTTTLVESSSETKSSLYSYVRLRVFEDNSVEVLSKLLDPQHFTQIKRTVFNCRISNGHDQNAVLFYYRCRRP